MDLGSALVGVAGVCIGAIIGSLLHKESLRDTVQRLLFSLVVGIVIAVLWLLAETLGDPGGVFLRGALVLAALAVLSVFVLRDFLATS